MNGESRGPWYLLTGLVIGISLGLLYAWVFQPVKYVDTIPASLRADFKDQYRALIAAAYLGNSDLLRARERLELLEDEDVFRALSEQAQRTLAQQGPDEDARALGLLAIALGQAPPGPAVVITQQRLTPIVQSTRIGGAPLPGETAATGSAQPTGADPTRTPEKPTPTPAVATSAPPVPASTSPTAATSPQLISTPQPTLSSTATPAGPFLLLSQEKLCETPLTAPLVQIEALDRFNNPVAGVLVIVTWAGGEDRFLTGLKPEKGPGYADFAPMPGTLYTLRLGENGEAVTDLAGLMCTPTSGAPYWGAWLLKFVQP
jgi:hypothetical protein